MAFGYSLDRYALSPLIFQESADSVGANGVSISVSEDSDSDSSDMFSLKSFAVSDFLRIGSSNYERYSKDRIKGCCSCNSLIGDRPG